MTEYALVSPSDEIDRYASNVDPGVETKSGWRWLTVERTQDSPGTNQVLDATSAPVIAADKVAIHTPARDMTEDEIRAAAPRVQTYVIVRRLEAAGLGDIADAALSQNRSLFRRFYTVGSVMVADPDARAFLKAIGADLDVILAPENS